MGILNMKRMLLLLAFIAPIVVCAEPSSQIAWTPELLNLVKKGNADKGKVLAESCKSCHGDKGQGMKEETSYSILKWVKRQIQDLEHFL